MSFELTYARRAMLGIQSEDVKTALNHLCKAIDELQRENETIKRELQTVKMRTR